MNLPQFTDSSTSRDMTDQFDFEKKDGYLLVTISDTVITPERAHEVLELIGDECGRLNCNKVLLDERTVQRRDVPRPEILKLGKDFPAKALNKVNIAFLCKKHLIDEDAKLLRIFSFANEYLIKHFADIDEAINWLKKA